MIYRKKKEPEKCDWSNEFGVTIHRFDIGSNICRCGKEKVEKKDEKPKYGYGFKKKFKKIFESNEEVED